ncbi:hypothetical protein QS257_06360 [Terrilactibacillus sp. S3-3]|nr:hypothetical protein QS257_06360 [Terrilactibacillus sp. S3-3]
MLADIASLKVRPSVVTSEKDGAPIAIITGNITTPDIGTVTKQINRTLNNSQLPKGIHVDFGGIPEQVRQLIASAAFLPALSPSSSCS